MHSLNRHIKLVHTVRSRLAAPHRVARHRAQVWCIGLACRTVTTGRQHILTGNFDDDGVKPAFESQLYNPQAGYKPTMLTVRSNQGYTDLHFPSAGSSGHTRRLHQLQVRRRTRAD